MNNRPFTLIQARAISSDYQWLIGSLYERNSFGKGNINCVAVAPFEESRLWQFAQYYKEYRDAQKALKFYQGPHYEVVILSVPLLSKRGICYRDLLSYLKEYDIPFLKDKYE